MTEQRVEAFLAAADRAGLFLDYDGTLSPIVSDPAAARPLEGVPPLLASLAARFAVVAVVSGRSAHQLVQWLGPRVEIWGLHGAERAVDGRVSMAPDVEAYSTTMRSVLDEVNARVRELGLPGAGVEDKAAIVALHYRNCPDPQVAHETLADLAREVAERHGLVLGGGRRVIEIRPPVELSKSAVLLARAREAGLEAAAFAGDDVVDLPAFDALDELEAEGAATLRIAVSSEESPEEVLHRADVVVEGPQGLRALLEGFLEN